jgi:hypothetical protein
MERELIVPNKFKKLVKILKKDSNKVLCKIEKIFNINYFVLGNGKFIICYPDLIEQVSEGIYDYEYTEKDKYHGKFLLKLNPSGFDYPVINFFNKEIVKDFNIELAYKKEKILYEFVKNFDDIFPLDILDIIYEIFEKRIVFYQLDTCFMVTENNRYISNPFDSCSIKLFFTGMK